MQPPGLQLRRVNVDLPSWMMEMVDRKAKRVGMTCRSVVEADQFNFRCTHPVMVTGVAD